MRYSALSLMLLAVLAACAGHRRPSPPDVAPDTSPAVPPETPAGISAVSPVLPSQKLINMLMYQFSVPYGQISRSAAFWKLLEEDAVDVSTQRTLQINGLRVGRGKMIDWKKFREILDQGSTTFIDTRFTCLPDQDLELDMAPKTDEQTLWVFDEHDWSGRSFGESANRFAFRFQWAPHKTDTLRARLCPVVVALRSRLDYAIGDEGIETPYVKRDNLYDLGLVADIAPGEFLAIGLAADATNPDCVGRRFLSTNGSTQQSEKLLVLVGEDLELDKAHPPSTQSTTQPTTATGQTR